MVGRRETVAAMGKRPREGGNKCDEKGSDFFPSRSLHTRVVEDCTAKAIGRARKEQNHKSSQLPSQNPPKKNG